MAKMSFTLTIQSVLKAISGMVVKQKRVKTMAGEIDVVTPS